MKFIVHLLKKKGVAFNTQWTEHSQTVRSDHGFSYPEGRVPRKKGELTCSLITSC